MTIESIIAGLPADLRHRLERDSLRAKDMIGGGQLQEWLDYEVGLQGIRSEAMRAAHTNQPKGRGYNEAHMLLMQHYGLDRLDKTSVTAVLWLTDPTDKYGPETLTRKQILDRIRAKMTDPERSRMSSPITARQRVEKQIVELAKESNNEVEADVGAKPPSKAKQDRDALAKALQENHHLKERLKRSDEGSLFDLQKDNAESIWTAIIGNASPHKAEAIFKGGLAALKRKQQKHAG